MRTYAASLRCGLPSWTTERLRGILDAGFDRVVLEDPLHHATWEKLQHALPREATAAIRLFLPYPPSLRVGEPSPYRLDVPGASDRREVLRLARRTLETADNLRIPLVLLPVATLETEAVASSALDCYRAALEPLLDLADRFSLMLCLTPTPRRREAPGLAAALGLLRELRGAPLAFWLDTARLEGLLLSGREGETASPIDPMSQIRGVSIRDVRGEEEGLVPGRGETDWSSAEIDRSIRAAPIWSLDLAPHTAIAELARGREFFAQYDAGPRPQGGGILMP
jgi:hypothetical protein